MADIAERSDAGQAVYTRRALRVYDFLVLGISNRFFWKCPTRILVDLYTNHVTSNHLDVGVGTGYFLDRCRFPTAAPDIVLMDPNPNTLEFTYERIERYRPGTHLGSVFEPIPGDVGMFDSVGINYVLHCLPGTIESKAVAFDCLKEVMNHNAVIFGATLLQRGPAHNWMAQRLMALYNKKGIFSNRSDSLEGLNQVLVQRFMDVSIQVVGCAAIFTARASKRDEQFKIGRTRSGTASD